jgi:hypothetical protein
MDPPAPPRGMIGDCNVQQQKASASGRQADPCLAPGGTAAWPIWLAAAAICAPWLGCLGWRCLNLDLWYDEVFTLNHFVFVHLRTTLTDYHLPNNHIFFNVLGSLYASAAGLPDIHAVLDRPWVLRIVPLIYAIAAMAVTFRTARRCTGRMAACLAMLVLATTVPFFNVATQIRGYSLSTLLIAIVLDRLLQIEDAPRMRDLLLAATAGALALYTIPSNLFILAALAVFYAVAAITRASRTRALLPNRYLLAALAVGAAVLGAAVLYLPVWRDVLFNETVQSFGLFSGNTLTVLMPRTLWYLLSGRYLLLALVVAAAAMCLATRPRPGEVPLRRRYLLCLAILILPFVCSWARGDKPPDRIFVPVCPALALLAALSAQLLCGRLAWRPALAGAVLAIAGLYGYAMLAASLRDIDRHLQADILAGRKSQDCFYGYYQAHYHPRQVVEQLWARRKAEPAPVFVRESGDHIATNIYLLRRRVPYLFAATPAEMTFSSQGVAYLLTAWPHLAIERFRQAYPTIDFKPLTPGPAFQGVLVCRQRPPHDDPAASAAKPAAAP